MRSSLALIATAGLVAVALSGCASAPAPEAAAGQSSDAIVVTGDFGKTPDVEFPKPIAPEETQCTEVIAGEGDLLTEGQQALVGLAVYNGTTGDELQVAGFDGDDPVPVVVTDPTLPGIRKGLTCAREGSRVVVVVPQDDGFGPDGNPSIGLNPGDSLVYVLDVHKVFPARAEGAARLSRDGFPAVVLAPDGRPGITVPEVDPPETVEVETLKEGDGPVVQNGDTVVVQYTGVTWADGKVFESTWETAEEGNKSPGPQILVVGEGGQVVPGFSEAVVGQKVGSQVAVIVPPSEGYGDQASAKVPANSTLFYVIDILGVI